MRTTTEHARHVAAARRGSDAERPLADLSPHLRHLVHLQRTAGNRAVTTLMRQVTGAAPAGTPKAKGTPKASGTPRGGSATRTQRPAAPPPIEVRLVMETPQANPAPDYSGKVSTSAWEQAKFQYQVRAFGDPVAVTAGNRSYVTGVTFELKQPTFQLFVDKQFSDDTLAELDVREARRMRLVRSRILSHAALHFAAYRNAVAALRPRFQAKLQSLPSRTSPVGMAPDALSAHVVDLLDHLHGRLRHAVDQSVCDVEKADYPKMSSELRKQNLISTEFRVGCATPAEIPPEPVIVRGRR